MPLYEYACTKCGHQMSTTQTIADRRKPCERPCVSCQTSGSVELRISTPAIAYSVGNPLKKTPEGFKDILRRIDANTPGSNIDV